MSVEIRLDAGKLGKVERTPQGGVRIPASLTRAGVFSYRNPDGSTRREFCPPEEVFRQDTIDSLGGAPVIVGHSAWVTPANHKDVAVGHVAEGSVRQDGNVLAGKVVVSDADTLKRVDSGELSEISLGYSLQYTPTPGEWQGQRYDGVQSKRVINHVALLPPGTSRTDVGFRFDAADDLSGAPVSTFLGPVPSEPKPQKAQAMIIRFDGKEYDVSKPEGALALQQAGDKVREDAKAAESARDKVQAKADQFAADLAKAEAQLKDTARFDAAVTERVDLEGKARAILGAKYDTKGKTNRDLQLAVIRHDSKDFSDKDRSDDYVAARFDSIAEKATRADSIHAVRKVKSDPAPETRADEDDETREDENEYPVARAQRENEERQRNQWREPAQSEEN
jgi:uncharacterized protein